MSVLDMVISVVAPHICVRCGSEGSLLCPACYALLEMIPERCYRCHKLSEGYRTCRSCRSSSALRSVTPVTYYAGVAKELVWRLKYDGAQAAARTIARSMMTRVSESESILMPVPTTSRRARQRGYDQAVLITRRLSQATGLRVHTQLVRTAKTHQVGASRAQRLTQVKHAFRTKNTTQLQGVTVLLVDDVLTTGATLEAAARTLRKAGAKHVDAIVFAQA